MICTLLQAPKGECRHNSPIIIIDNLTALGKGNVEERIQEGYHIVGALETELTMPELKVGLEYYWRQQVEEAHNLFQQIAGIANGYLAE